MPTVKIAVVGSRSITNVDYVFSVLDFYLARLLKENECIIVSGRAVGIDSIAEKFAEQRKLKNRNLFTWL